MIEFPTPEVDNEELLVDEQDNLVVLNDEDGNPVEFELLDMIEYEGNEYVFLVPPEESEIVILRVEAEDADSEEDTLVGVTDEETLNTLFAIFKDRNKDVFTFAD